jgi:hypothetical protein
MKRATAAATASNPYKSQFHNHELNAKFIHTRTFNDVNNKFFSSFLLRQIVQVFTLFSLSLFLPYSTRSVIIENEYFRRACKVTNKLLFEQEVVCAREYLQASAREMLRRNNNGTHIEESAV